jgi:hypothetical protein
LNVTEVTVSYLNVIIETAGLVLPAVQQPKCIAIAKVFKLVVVITDQFAMLCKQNVV